MPIVGIGTDIVEISRIEAQLAKSHRLAERVLTQAEHQQFCAHSFQARFLAKRFAAKEAVVKAVGSGIGNGIGFQQIEVKNLDSGQPVFEVTGQLAELFKHKNVTAWHLSLSDERHYAVANVVLESR